MYKNDYYAMASVMVDDPADFAEVFFSITDVNACNKYGQTALMLAVKLNLYDIALDLINHHSIDVNKRNSKGETAFMMTIRYYAFIPLLLAFKKKHGFDINVVDNRGRSAFLLAAEFNHVVLKVLTDDDSVNTRQVDEDGDNALMIAAHSSQFANVKHLLKDPQINVNQKNYLGETALMCAEESDIFLVLLQDMRVDINERDNEGNTSLMRACVHTWS